MTFWSPTRAKTILFDLDGTLTESGEGIIKSVQYALEKMGRPEPDLHKLRVFIGPPLLEQFMKYAQMTRPEAEKAVCFYRERYLPVGIFENSPYPGIPEMLKTLTDSGLQLAVASSKTEDSVNRVLAHYGLASYFDAAVGSEPDGRGSKKAEVIEETLRRLHLEQDREQVIMVGDKEHDVEGARLAGLRCVAVGYGYGTFEELMTVKPFKIVQTVEELTSFLLNGDW